MSYLNKDTLYWTNQFRDQVEVKSFYWKLLFLASVNLFIDGAETGLKPDDFLDIKESTPNCDLSLQHDYLNSFILF